MFSSLNTLFIANFCATVESYFCGCFKTIVVPLSYSLLRRWRRGAGIKATLYNCDCEHKLITKPSHKAEKQKLFQCRDDDGLRCLSFHTICFLFYTASKKLNMGLEKPFPFYSYKYIPFRVTHYSVSKRMYFNNLI